MSISSSLFKMI